MDLKTFKSGIDYIAKATNQRMKEPEPFLLQVGKDGLISLCSGDATRTYVWRTGVRSDMPRGRFGVSSKMLTQSVKVLKGNVTVSLEPTEYELALTTSNGGKVKIPYVDEPTLLPPRLGEAEAFYRFPEGRLPQLVRSIESTSVGDLSRGVQFLGNDGRLTIISTEDHKAFITYENAEIPTDNLQHQWGTPASFWMPLRAATTNGDVTFFQIGVRVRAQNFEAYGAFKKVPVMDIRSRHFSSPPSIMAVTNRKVLIDAIKGITPDDKTGTIDFSLQAEGQFAVSQHTQHIGLPLRRHKGWGRIGVSAEYMVDILSAIEGKEVILAWHEDASKPIGIRDTSRQNDVFILAPRVKV